MCTMEGPVRYMLSVLTLNVQTPVLRLTPGFLILKDLFCEYMHVLASHEVNHLVVPPSHLWKILIDIKDEFCSHSRLELPDYPDVKHVDLLHCYVCFSHHHHGGLLHCYNINTAY